MRRPDVKIQTGCIALGSVASSLLHHVQKHHGVGCTHRSSLPNGGDEDEEWDEDMPCEPAGHGEIAIGSVSGCSAFWRTFVRSSAVMDWIEKGYRLLWTVAAPLAREMANAPSAADHRDFVSGAVEEMLAGGVVTLLSPGEKPLGGEPLGGGAEASNKQVQANG